uniref:NADH-ubiquinone oxidoreductase chain 2 n=1 Tax=Phelsuma dubia TaxID=357323 RepID=B1PHS6_9SAUR|nr:NADH dehydrogenase subunit 2 [Phelsuma dubia]
MNPLAWAMMISSLSTSTILTLSSYHWLVAWIGLELNTLSMLPIIAKLHHPRATEAATKYFIVQATGAALIMFASTMNAWATGQWEIINMLPIPTAIATLAILLKLGIAPMHFWYPEVLQGSTLNTALVLTTWQKLAPLSLLYLMMLNTSTEVLLITGALSTMIAGVAGLNETQTRKIMAFSSIGHMGWLMLTIPFNLNLTTLTIMMYIMLTSSMFYMLKTVNAPTLKDLSQTNLHSPMLMTMMMIILMSLGGLPPLTGFMPKLLILKTLTDNNLLALAGLVALTSLPSLFFYLRITYLTTLTAPPKISTSQYKWRLKTHFKPKYLPLMIYTIFLMPMTPLLLNT